MAYKIGIVLIIIWVIYIFYGFSNYDEIMDASKLAILLLVSFIGIILFPIYFIAIYLINTYKERKFKV
ncbi:hypothetical protein [Bacillus sp. Marseille-P3661]|uniref:hypothetical protein n=1 Tax=Bacillus sp. Marseille-P3661 TaxID=1936234 RepID=UPI000C82D3B0|nr:hypothetical protein [Bacillus sp. Marseille-P3661]